MRKRIMLSVSRRETRSW